VNFAVRLELDIAHAVKREFDEAVGLAAALLDDDSVALSTDDPARFQVAHDLRHSIEIGQDVPDLDLGRVHAHRHLDRDQSSGLLDPHDEVAIRIPDGGPGR
jgi:hypothetical protein